VLAENGVRAGQAAAQGGWPTAREPAAAHRAVQENLENLGVEALDVVNLRLKDAPRGLTRRPFGSSKISAVAQRLRIATPDPTMPETAFRCADITGRARRPGMPERR